MKLVLSILLLSSYFGYSQTAIPLIEAREKGIFDNIEKAHTPALGDDGVFKTEEDQQKLIDAYHNYLRGLGKFLLENNFKWEVTTKGWNRIYMQPDGTIDYFIYSLKNLSVEKQKEFERLLNLYIKDHKFGISAPVGFSQCSPVTYPKSE